MDLERDIGLIESAKSKSAPLFYDAVDAVLGNAGFILSNNAYVLFKDKTVNVTSDSGLKELIASPKDLDDIKFMELFLRTDDICLIGAFTTYKGMDDFLGKTFDKYALACNMPIMNVMVQERDSIFDRDGTYFAARDFDRGMITKVGSHYYFTLTSLIYAITDSIFAPASGLRS